MSYVDFKNAVIRKWKRGKVRIGLILCGRWWILPILNTYNYRPILLRAFNNVYSLDILLNFEKKAMRKGAK